MGNTRVKNLKGEQGGDYIADGSATGSWLAGVCITDVAVTAITQPSMNNTAALIAAGTLAAGTVIYGLTTAITVTGTIAMFNAEDPDRFPDMSNT